jgi:hypothetical protein
MTLDLDDAGEETFTGLPRLSFTLENLVFAYPMCSAA